MRCWACTRCAGRSIRSTPCDCAAGIRFALVVVVVFFRCALLGLRRFGAARRVPPRQAANLLSGPKDWIKRPLPNFPTRAQRLSGIEAGASPVRLEQRWPEAARHLPRPCHPGQGCVAQTSTRRDRGMRGSVLPSNLLSGTTAEATAVARGGCVRAGQASRSAWGATDAPASTRSLESASWSNFLARQKVGRPPGRDPARCNAPATPWQGVKAKSPTTALSPHRPGIAIAGQCWPEATVPAPCTNLAPAAPAPGDTATPSRPPHRPC